MEDPRWSVQDAKNRFSEVVEAAREKPQTVTKHGKRAVVVVAAEEYDRLKTLEKQKAITFNEHLLNMPRDNGTFERMKAPLRQSGF
ncbi:MAG: type II toxin-antitoxin system Phd/YefM family antitoxin [Proteobacteria bacterium]|nr:type II toxin-antitoxin system Phd/YefM family antitoxin [Pseudomonadota bacterium]